MKRHRAAAGGPRRVVSLVMGVSLLVAGCGADGDEGAQGAQPRPDVTTFEAGSFDDIPLVRESDPVTPPNEKDGVDSRSYVVRNTTPAEVLEFYERQLAESTLVSGPEEVGNDTYRGRWELDGGRLLTVSATPGGTFEQGESAEAGQLLTQYSLSLAPAEG